MLQSIALENFKNHVRTELTDLGQMTVLVGPNGAGKSSLLEAVSVTAEHPETDSHGATPAEDRIYERFFRRSVLEEEAMLSFELLLRVEGTVWRCAAAWLSGAFGGGSSFSFDSVPPATDLDAREYMEKRAKASRLRRRLRPFALIASQIANASVSDSSSPTISPDGSRTASVLASLQMSRPRVALAISEAVSRIVPTVKEVRTRRVSVRQTDARTIRVDATAVPFADTREVIGEELVFDMLSGDNVPASGASAGTLVVTALMTALLAEAGPRVLLLDDIETGLHPEAQREVIAMLREMCAQDPDLQILMTTHSPYVVDGFDPKDVWVVVADGEGLAHTRRLSDHPDSARAQQTLATGELWTAFGEDWALTPGPEKNAG